MTTNTLNRCTISSLNCEGFNRNSDYLNDVLTTHRPTFFCIQETWLLDEGSSTINSIHNAYVTFRPVCDTRTRSRPVYLSVLALTISLSIYFMTIFFIKPIEEVPMRVSYRYVGNAVRSHSALREGSPQHERAWE